MSPTPQGSGRAPSPRPSAPRPTSYRLDPTVKDRLAGAAEAARTSERALLEQLIVEGLDQLAHPSIVFRDGPAGRRAALAGGPDVWEVISALRWTEGSDEDRVGQLSEQFDLHVRQVRVAIDYAAANRHAIDAQVAANDAAARQAEQQVQARADLMGPG